MSATEKAPSSLAIYLRLLGYVRPYVGLFAISILGFAIFSSTQPMLGYILKYFVDGLGDPTASLFAGSPWLLGSVAMMQHIRNLVPLAAPYIAEMRRLYPVLENHVHADNRVAVRWLRAVGFVLEPAAPYGLHGALFHRFTMKA